MQIFTKFSLKFKPNLGSIMNSKIIKDSFMDYLALAHKYQTPLYVYDFDHITTQYERLKKEFNTN